MGSVLFRNRYWFYKSLYDDYIGREMRLAFGLSMFLWMPHYWYVSSINLGTVSTSTEPWRKATPGKTTLSSTNPGETDLHTTSFTKNSKWFSKTGSNSNNNTTQVTLVFNLDGGKLL